MSLEKKVLKLFSPILRVYSLSIGLSDLIVKSMQGTDVVGKIKVSTIVWSIIMDKGPLDAQVNLFISVCLEISVCLTDSSDFRGAVSSTG